ncbi:GNAT family N-acetyltransferase [Gloeothece verrucosa]|uniref:GCN5-related N-acetyltransferase n=1 Tax=Gloeothece verrucosa (strain PCC 7822) TaxID=497965 RepID=E0UK90_GLOV7|nr:GNAT family N-acetyltransferase [Gloeothece verrucosa]ADN15852.1 GCN5-related N-acetyltransferase [Gloeothece verrucosa PCC 7822]
MTENKEIKVRTATHDDVSLIFSFLQKKSEFDRNIGAYSGVLQVTEDKICKTIFGPVPFAYVIFAENLELAFGFALYEFRYSSFAGQPSIWVDDLYVDEDMRNQGVGMALMSYLAQVAKENDCTHLSWTADARNSGGLNFYYRLGAKIIEQKGHRCFFTWIPEIITLL